MDPTESKLDSLTSGIKKLTKEISGSYASLTKALKDNQKNKGIERTAKPIVPSFTSAFKTFNKQLPKLIVHFEKIGAELKLSNDLTKKATQQQKKNQRKNELEEVKQRRKENSKPREEHWNIGRQSGY